MSEPKDTFVGGTNWTLAELKAMDPKQRRDLIRAICRPEVEILLENSADHGRNSGVSCLDERPRSEHQLPDRPKFRCSTQLKFEPEFLEAMHLSALQGNPPVYSSEDHEEYNRLTAVCVQSENEAEAARASADRNEHLRMVWIRLAKACVDAATAVSQAADKARFSEAADWVLEQIEAGMRGVFRSQLLQILNQEHNF